MSKDNKELVLEAFRRVDKHDFVAMAELFIEDVEFMTPFSAASYEPGKPDTLSFHGRQEVIDGFGPLADSFPNSRHEMQKVLEVGDHVVLEGEWFGKNEGDFPTGPGNFVKATGKSVQFPFCAIARVDGDLIASIHIHHDRMLMLSQLGLM